MEESGSFKKVMDSQPREWIRFFELYCFGQSEPFTCDGCYTGNNDETYEFSFNGPMGYGFEGIVMGGNSVTFSGFLTDVTQCYSVELTEQVVSVHVIFRSRLNLEKCSLTNASGDHLRKLC